MTFYCSECDVGWWPSMAKDGCPSCGAGTVRDGKPPPDNVSLLYVLARIEAERRERIKAFEAYYVKHLERQQAA